MMQTIANITAKKHKNTLSASKLFFFLPSINKLSLCLSPMFNNGINMKNLSFLNTFHLKRNMLNNFSLIRSFMKKPHKKAQGCHLFAPVSLLQDNNKLSGKDPWRKKKINK